MEGRTGAAWKKRAQHGGKGARTAHDEELARQGAPLQLPGQALGLQLGHHQCQNGHVGAVLGHQAGCAPRTRIANDQARL